MEKSNIVNQVEILSCQELANFLIKNGHGKCFQLITDKQLTGKDILNISEIEIMQCNYYLPRQDLRKLWSFVSELQNNPSNVLNIKLASCDSKTTNKNNLSQKPPIPPKTFKPKELIVQEDTQQKPEIKPKSLKTNDANNKIISKDYSLLQKPQIEPKVFKTGEGFKDISQTQPKSLKTNECSTENFNRNVNLQMVDDLNRKSMSSLENYQENITLTNGVHKQTSKTQTNNLDLSKNVKNKIRANSIDNTFDQKEDLNKSAAAINKLETNSISKQDHFPININMDISKAPPRPPKKNFEKDNINVNVSTSVLEVQKSNKNANLLLLPPRKENTDYHLKLGGNSSSGHSHVDELNLEDVSPKIKWSNINKELKNSLAPILEQNAENFDLNFNEAVPPKLMQKQNKPDINFSKSGSVIPNIVFQFKQQYLQTKDFEVHNMKYKPDTLEMANILNSESNNMESLYESAPEISNIPKHFQIEKLPPSPLPFKPKTNAGSDCDSEGYVLPHFQIENLPPPPLPLKPKTNAGSDCDSEGYVMPRRDSVSFSINQQNKPLPPTPAPDVGKELRDHSNFRTANRDEAELYLSKLENGSFLLRPSSCFFGTLVVKGTRIFNIPIIKKDNLMYLGSDNPTTKFANIHELILYYQSNHIPVVTTEQLFLK